MKCRMNALDMDISRVGENMMNENYYKNMPEDFKKAVAVIKDYCQNEECAADCECDECPYPLSVIRCGDVER
jgi:hypothetical protein